MACLLPAIATLGLGSAALAQPPAKPGIIPLSSAVGIRVSVADERPELLEADLDLTMYTRFPCSCSASASTYAGALTFGIPAIDYGDGATLSYTTLALASPGGGPGGSNVFRSLASFTHTYPSLGSYTVTAGMFCTACLRGAYSVFPPGSPGSPVYSTSFDYLPTTVIGKLAARYVYSYTTSTEGGDYSARLLLTYYGAVTNTAQVVLSLPSIIEVPTVSIGGLLLLATVLLGAGLLLLRRG